MFVFFIPFAPSTELFNKNNNLQNCMSRSFKQHHFIRTASNFHSQLCTPFTFREGQKSQNVESPPHKNMLLRFPEDSNSPINHQIMNCSKDSLTRVYHHKRKWWLSRCRRERSVNGIYFNRNNTILAISVWLRVASSHSAPTDITAGSSTRWR